MASAARATTADGDARACLNFWGTRPTWAAAVYANTQPLGPGDVAEAVVWAAAQPPHVNINVIELMPVVQSFAPFQIQRS